MRQSKSGHKGTKLTDSNRNVKSGPSQVLQSTN
jgi:hypothetical protein